MDKVLEIVGSYYKDNQLIIVGLVFQTICEHNTFYIAEQAYVIKEITYFGRSIDCIERGITAEFLVESSSNNVPETEKYAYMEV